MLVAFHVHNKINNFRAVLLKVLKVGICLVVNKSKLSDLHVLVYNKKKRGRKKRGGAT